MDFNEARYVSRMTTQDIADYLEISHRTVLRYKKTGIAPKSVIECMLMIGGHCPSFTQRNDFTGWSFGSGYLWSPEGDKFTSGDVRAGKMALLESYRLHRQLVSDRKQKKEQNTAKIIPFPVAAQAKKNLVK